MAQDDIKFLLHHLNDMYKSIGVLNSSLADISPYIDSAIHEELSRGISSIDKCIDEIGSNLYLTYKKRIGK
jgi:hypothetical protein